MWERSDDRRTENHAPAKDRFLTDRWPLWFSRLTFPWLKLNSFLFEVATLCQGGVGFCGASKARSTTDVPPPPFPSCPHPQAFPVRTLSALGSRRPYPRPPTAECRCKAPPTLSPPSPFSHSTPGCALLPPYYSSLLPPFSLFLLPHTAPPLPPSLPASPHCPHQCLPPFPPPLPAPFLRPPTNTRASAAAHPQYGTQLSSAQRLPYQPTRGWAHAASESVHTFRASHFHGSDMGDEEGEGGGREGR